MENTKWLIVAGGYKQGDEEDDTTLQETEILELGVSSPRWKSMGKLQLAGRGPVSLVSSEKGVLAMGGDFISIQLLDWNLKEWKVIKPNLHEKHWRYTWAWTRVLELPSSIFNCKVRSPATVSLHDLEDSEHKEKHDEYSKQGYQLVLLDGYLKNGKRHYLAVWEKQTGPKRIHHLGMTLQEYKQKLAENNDKGYQVIYVDGGDADADGGDADEDGQKKPFFSAIWEETDVSHVSDLGLSSAAYEKTHNNWISRGYQPAHISGYTVGGVDKYAAIWKKKTGLEYVTHHAMSEDIYEKNINKYKKLGFHITKASMYARDGTVLFAAIWEKMTSPCDQSKHRLRSEHYQNEIQKQEKAGFKIHHVSACSFCQQGKKRKRRSVNGPLFLHTFHKESDQIVVQYTHGYDLIWKDKGSQGSYDVSIWRPISVPGYCILGDVAVKGYRKPLTPALLVKKSDAVTVPSGFHSKWNTDNTYAPVGSIWKMEQPGFKCLGGAANNNEDNAPDTSHFCCVKTKYVVEGKLEFTWNDKGTGWFRDDGSIWTVVSEDNKGINGGNFQVYSSHKHDENDVGYLLNENRVTEESGKIIVHTRKVYDQDPIWTTAGMDVDFDVSIFRPKSEPGYCILGDVAVKGFGNGKPLTPALLIERSDEVKSPTGFVKKWDADWGQDNPGSIWKMNPPVGFTCLGGAASRNLKEPDPTEFCCVKNQYVVKGKVKKTWDDKGSGSAIHDGSIWTVVSSGDGGISGGNFLVNREHGSPEDEDYPDYQYGYLLKESRVTVIETSPYGTDYVKLSKNVKLKYFNKNNKWIGSTWEHGGQWIKFTGSKLIIGNQNPADYSSLSALERATNFIPDAETIFVAHGFSSSGTICDNFVKKYQTAKSEAQVICIDWSELAFLGLNDEHYYREAKNSIDVGCWLGLLLHSLVQHTKKDGLVQMTNIHLIGHSLGAHVVGNMGRTFSAFPGGNKVTRVTGLDPAGPRFIQDDDGLKKHRIGTDSGSFVDIIHTNGDIDAQVADPREKDSFFHLGDLHALGHADFYPNGGRKQRKGGCMFGNSYCSHTIATDYYIASINNKQSMSGGSDEFLSYPCASAEKCVERDSSNNPNHMGEFAKPPSKNELYYLPVQTKGYITNWEHDELKK